MTSRDGKTARSWRMSLTGFLVLTLAFALNNARAQEASAVSPHTSVSSDGSVIEPTGMEQGTHGENGYRGTGRPTERTPIESEAAFEEMVALPDPGDDGSESIIGADGRVLTSPTTSYPARAVALVTFTGPGPGGRCTGWFIGRDTVVTAGHCVYDFGAWKTGVRVYPGRNGALSPYGVCTAKRLHSVTGWTVSKDERYDYGAIKLNCTIGTRTGWFGYWWQTASLTGLPTTISGYPGDKPLTQWKSFDIVRTTQTRQIFYQNDTTGGMSGSPVYQFRERGSSFCGITDDDYCVMGIHAYGLHGSSLHLTNNHGTRITQAVHNNLVAWKKDAR